MRSWSMLGRHRTSVRNIFIVAYSNCMCAWYSEKSDSSRLLLKTAFWDLRLSMMVLVLWVITEAGILS